MASPQQTLTRQRNRLKDQTASYGKPKPNVSALLCRKARDFSAGERRRYAAREGRVHSRGIVRRVHCDLLPGSPAREHREAFGQSVEWMRRYFDPSADNALLFSHMCTLTQNQPAHPNYSRGLGRFLRSNLIDEVTTEIWNLLPDSAAWNSGKNPVGGRHLRHCFPRCEPECARIRYSCGAGRRSRRYRSLRLLLGRQTCGSRPSSWAVALHRNGSGS
jgi:hypothetical protein